MEIVKKINRLLRRIILKDGVISYSQSGEDLILDTIFLSKPNGFYIDIGANHPTRASNTFYFYKKGWSGINIDALPSAIDLFNKKRKRDVNILTGIGKEESVMDYYSFKETSYNTFDASLVSKIKKVTDFIEVRKIQVRKISTILKEKNIKEIDFMSVDVEGFDLSVLESNDWSLFRPKIVVVEDFEFSIEKGESRICNFMKGKGYILFCKSVTNFFYLDREFYDNRFMKKTN